MIESEKPLESWKEIAAYLRSGARTCQRWERELDLPIHRLDGTPKARVFAYKEELDRWRDTKLKRGGTARQALSPERARRRRPLIAAASAVCLLAVGAFVTARVFFLPLPPLPESRPTLAVLPFANATGEAQLDVWKTALPDLIITDMAQSRIVNVVRITDLYRGLKELGLEEADRFSDNDLVKIAERSGADRLVTGTLSRVGRGLVVSASVKDQKTAEAPRSVQAALRGVPGVFAAADDLTRGIKRGLGLAKADLARDIDRSVSRVSTSSPQAFLLYSQGFRLAGIEKYREGIISLQKAVELDPNFALAYKYLWRCSINTGRESDEKTYIRLAVDNAGRLSEKERGDVATLFFRNYEKDPAKEQEALRRLWRYHPDDRFGGIQLMAFYREREDWTNMRSAAEQGLAANRKEVIFCDGLVRSYENLGQGSRAEEVLDEFIASNPDHPYLVHLFDLKFYHHLLHGQTDAALKVLDLLDSRLPNTGDRVAFATMKAIAQIYRNDFPAAEAELRGLLSASEPRAVIEARLLLRDACLLQGKIGEGIGHLRWVIDSVGKADETLRRRVSVANVRYELAYLLRLTGDLPEALGEVEAALEVADQLPRSTQVSEDRLEAMKLKALLLLEMERVPEFEAEAEKVRQLVDQGNSPGRKKYYVHLLGHGELRKGNARRAAQYLWRAVDILSIPGVNLDGADPEFLFSLGMTYDLLEGWDLQAQGVYEQILLPTVNRLHKGDLYVRSLYSLGRIHEARAGSQGSKDEEIRVDRAKAAGYYRRFIDFWKNADPLFSAELADAGRRLVSLNSR